ncbi:LamG domain-containing protein [Planctomycetota bacterium]
MFQKLVYSILLLVSGLIVSVASADITSDLVAWWALDDGSGTMAKDSADHPGGPHDGTLQNGPQWENADVMIGKGALMFDGLDDRIVVESFDLEGSGITIAAWIKPPDLAAMNDPRMVSKAQGGGTGDHYWAMVLSGSGEDNLEFRLRTDSGAATRRTSPEGNDMQADEWAHLAVTWDAGDPFMRLYKNGEEIDSVDKSGTAVGVGPSVRIGVGNQSVSAGADSMDRPFPGILDDVRIYERGLSTEDITELFGWQGTPVPSTMARNPTPSDGILIEDTWVNLSWIAGDFAVSHDVYLGDNFSEVEEATRESDVFRGNQTTTFYVAGFPGFAYPDGLVAGTVYYWRIDEVNEADPNSPWKGNIWSFSIPPKTAYNPDPADGAEFVGSDNVTLSWTPGFGAKLHTVYLGTAYDEVSNATVGVPSGSANYNPGTLELEKVYYWRIDEFDSIATYKGDIWAFTTPGAAGVPQPANGAADVEHTQILLWTPADNANSHDIYFGTDAEAVENATTASPEYKGNKASGSESYDPGQLDWDTSYYWRVDAVYSTGTVNGLVWHFTTADFLVVDDFESYTDDDAAGQTIWQTWIDGLDVADNGAQVGYLFPPYTEQTIVHSGLQSMPMLYVNETGVTNSEASFTLTTPRDWTVEDVGELSLWFRGDSANAAEPLYVAISNAAGAPGVVAHSEANAAQASTWRLWVIPLQAFADQGINLANVDKLAIGLGSKGGSAVGGSGTMYIDDIRLYRAEPQP